MKLGIKHHLIKSKTLNQNVFKYFLKISVLIGSILVKAPLYIAH